MLGGQDKNSIEGQLIETGRAISSLREYIDEIQTLLERANLIMRNEALDWNTPEEMRPREKMAWDEAEKAKVKFMLVVDYGQNNLPRTMIPVPTDIAARLYETAIAAARLDLKSLLDRAAFGFKQPKKKSERTSTKTAAS